MLESDSRQAARAKGLPERLIIRKHALRNAMLPTITVLALDVGFLIARLHDVRTGLLYIRPTGYGVLFLTPWLRSTYSQCRGVFDTSCNTACTLHPWRPWALPISTACFSHLGST